MLDATDTLPLMQRTRGEARAALVAGPSGARLSDLRQAGSAKAMLPRTHGPAPEVVFLNTSGGITGGDRLSYTLDVGPGARVTGTTQTAERAYRASSGSVPGRLDTRLSLGAGTRLDWLPQEVILFQGCNLARTTEVEMAADAQLTFLETLVPGRAAMGETLSALDLTDHRRIRRGGRLVFWEPLALAGPDLTHPACLAGARAVATLVVVAPDAADRLAPLRERLAGLDGVTGAASAWDGRLVARLSAADAWPMRRALHALVPAVTGAPLPRVWQS